MYLNHTSFAGELTPELLKCVPNLENLYLSHTGITGELTPELLKCVPNLENLYLSHTGITGELTPELLKSVKHLRELDLSHTGVTGEFSADLLRHCPLEYLNLDDTLCRSKTDPRNGRKLAERTTKVCLPEYGFFYL